MNTGDFSRMNYPETIDYLFSRLPVFHRVGKAAYKDGLENTLSLDAYFGNPHRRFRTIHVGGTNGKGSVSHMLAAILQQAGYRTGLYTSPHLMDFRERIRVNGEMIGEEQVVDFVEAHRQIVEQVQPSFFELTVAMAFEHFAQQKVDVAVIEVGLGGRLDSTNIITPVCSVITNISWDHTDLLGDSLEKIAWEKAGIIKPHIPAVVGEESKETARVFVEKARNVEAPLQFAGDVFSCIGQKVEADGLQHFEIRSADGRMFYPALDLLGTYQRLNVVTVYAVVQQLMHAGFALNLEMLSETLQRVASLTGLSGRWQVLRRDPLVICDTAHNEAGIREVVLQLGLLSAPQLHMVIGTVNDKPLHKVLKQLPRAAQYYFTCAAIPRALNPAVLKEEAAKEGLAGEVFPSVSEACSAAIARAGKQDVVFVGGSTFVVADLLCEPSCWK